MNLYLLRHGIAAERGLPEYADDSLRPLTEEGRRKVARVADAMAAWKLTFELVLASPYIRARETAEIVVQTLGLQKKLQFSEHLACDADPSALVEQVKAVRPPPEDVLLVGHEPDLSELVSLLLIGNRELPMTFKKAGLCKLAVSDLRPAKCATLEWLLTPKVMRLSVRGD
jgi:phosphohistidine phosphatase